MKIDKLYAMSSVAWESTIASLVARDMHGKAKRAARARDASEREWRAALVAVRNDDADGAVDSLSRAQSIAKRWAASHNAERDAVRIARAVVAS